LKLPRDLSGQQLATLLRPLGYEITRQTGSHIHLTSAAKGSEHHVSIPARSTLKVGTPSGILSEVAAYLELDKEELAQQLFGR
jgi:predicted RNA binding protein YcfA (HicA-like mRNA interferase family)